MKRLPEMLVLTLGLLVCFSGVWVFPLHEPDEGRYADIALGMAQSGDWLTPRLNGIRYFEKPPLFFWLAGLSIRLIGPSELAVRLPSVLGAFLTLVFTLRLATRLFGLRTGRFATLLLLTAPLFALFAKLALVDMLLTACITGAIGAVSVAALDNRTPSRRQALGFWALSGCACLAKGPIGLALPLLGFILFGIWGRRWVFLRGLVLNPVGLAAFGLAAGPWFVLMEIKNPGYLVTFLVEQNLGRVASTERFQSYGPSWYYLPFLAALLSPWTLFLPDVITRFTASLRATRQPLQGNAETTRHAHSRVLLNCLWIGPLFLFSCVQSKLPYYLLPLFPPLCVLIGDVIVLGRDGRERGLSAFRRRWLALAAVCFLAAGALTISYRQAEPIKLYVLRSLAEPADQEAMVERVNLIVSTAPYLAAASGLLGLACLWSTRWPGGLSAGPVIGALLLVACTLPWMAGRLGPLFSAKRVAVAVRAELSPGDKLLFFRRYCRTVTFYLGRPGILWSASWEEFGRSLDTEELARLTLQQRPERLRRLWSGPDRTIAVVHGSETRRIFEKMTGRVDSRVIGRFGRVVVLENRPRER